MPLRPIDAVFVHPEQRLYVIYYRGDLWQLPRMKIDAASWQRREPYTGAKEVLYLSQHQAIDDAVMAQKLRTLDLPEAVRGSTLPRFEDWWRFHGFEWLKKRLDEGNSPLAGHHSANTTAAAKTAQPSNQNSNTVTEKTTKKAAENQDDTSATQENLATDLAVVSKTNKTGNNNPKADSANTAAAAKVVADADAASSSKTSDNHTEQESETQNKPAKVEGDIFANMLAELTDEVIKARR